MHGRVSEFRNPSFAHYGKTIVPGNRHPLSVQTCGWGGKSTLLIELGHRGHATVEEPVGVDELAIGTDDLASQLPKPPEPRIADLLVGIAFIRSAAHLHGHGRSVVGEVSTGASNAGVIGPRRVQVHVRYLVNQPFAPWAQFVRRLTEKIIERRLRGLEPLEASRLRGESDRAAEFF